MPNLEQLDAARRVGGEAEGQLLDLARGIATALAVVDRQRDEPAEPPVPPQD